MSHSVGQYEGGKVPLVARGPLLHRIPTPIIPTLRRIILDIRLWVSVVVGFFWALFNAIVAFAMMLWPVLFYILVIWLVWYAVVLLWPFVMLVFVTVAIPIINIFVILFNIFFMVFIIILRIWVSVWNIIVPFLGMLLYLIVDVFISILTEIFNAIGSIDWEPIVTAIMNAIMPIVDIAMQILMVIIKVSADIIMLAAKVISFVIQILFSYIKIWIPVLIWVFRLLFVILQPILKILAVFFGGGGSPQNTSTARRLFSLGETTDGGYDAKSYEHFLREQMGAAVFSNFSAHLTPDDFLAKAYSQHADVAEPAAHASMKTRQRDLLQVWRTPSKSGLQFVEEEETHREGEHKTAEPAFAESDRLDDMGSTMAHTMYVHARGMRSDDMGMAHSTLNTILGEHKRRGALTLHAILHDYNKQFGHTELSHEERLSAVRYRGAKSEPEHPQELHERLSADRARHQRELFSEYGGRKLFDAADWESKQKEYMSELKLEHARKIAKQQSEYRDYHFHLNNVAQHAYNGASKSLKRTFETVVTPQALSQHWQGAMNQMGYDTVWDLWSNFTTTYGDAAGFIASLSVVTEHPFFAFFKEQEVRRTGRNDFFYDWQRAHSEYASGRRLFQASSGSDTVIGRGETTEAYNGFAIISPLGCTSVPKNPLCIPEIPANFSFALPKINLSERAKKELLAKPNLCTPWHFTYAPFSLDRLINVWYEFNFLLSAIPPLNYIFALAITMAPWTKPFLGWIFIVKPYETATITQWVCFVYHLYDVFITFILAWLLLTILKPFAYMFRDVYRQWKVYRVIPPHSAASVAEAKALERYLMHLHDNSRIQQRIGARFPATTEGTHYHTHFHEHPTINAHYTDMHRRFDFFLSGATEEESRLRMALFTDMIRREHFLLNPDDVDLDETQQIFDEHSGHPVVRRIDCRRE